jgi:hypothetical protein
VSTLRQRLGLGEGSFDLDLEKQVAGFQAAHGLPTTGKADADTLAALNRGAAYYERRLLLNMERARRLPAPGTAQKYVLVDAGSARLWMYENGQPVDSMKVVVGKTASATPMMAALMRFATVNPYWNVPPDLVAELIAPKVLSEGVAYLTERRYEVLDGWENDAKVIDAASVDWPAVAKGHLELRVRQLPGGANSMGAIKFMMPNEYGIYLHDTPSKALFAAENRWVSNGCVRLEDAERLARWVFGAMPRASDSKWEEHVPLQQGDPRLRDLSHGRCHTGWPGIPARSVQSRQGGSGAICRGGRWDGRCQSPFPDRSIRPCRARRGEDACREARHYCCQGHPKSRTADRGYDDQIRHGQSRYGESRYGESRYGESADDQGPADQNRQATGLEDCCRVELERCGSKTLQPPAKKKSAAPASSSEKRVIKKH